MYICCLCEIMRISAVMVMVFDCSTFSEPLKGTPLLEGNGADTAKFEKALKAADKLGETIANTTDKMMEMRKDIDGKQVIDD